MVAMRHISPKEAAELDTVETREWLDSLDYVLQSGGPVKVARLLRDLTLHATDPIGSQIISDTRLSNDGLTWQAPQACGDGTPAPPWQAWPANQTASSGSAPSRWSRSG